MRMTPPTEAPMMTFVLLGLWLEAPRSLPPPPRGRFSPGGFDDNDLVLRAQERGWDCVIAGDVYIHHEGSATFRLVAAEGCTRSIVEIPLEPAS